MSAVPSRGHAARASALRDPTNWVLVLAALSLVLLIVVPLLSIFREAFTDEDGRLTLANFVSTFSDRQARQATLNTIVLSLAVAALSTLIAIPLAFGEARTAMPFKRTLNAVALVSIISPGFLVALAYALLLGPNMGLVNKALRALLSLEQSTGPFDIYGPWGFVFLTLPMGIGLCFLQITPALRSIDASVEEASRLAGAGPLQTARRVTLKLIRPAILSGFILTFTLTLAAYGTPQVLGVNVLAIAIRGALLVTYDLKQAAVLSVAATVIAVAAVFVYHQSMRAQSRYVTLGGRGARQGLVDCGRWRHALVALTALYALFGFVLPYGALVVASFLRAMSRGFSLDNLTGANYAVLLSDEVTRHAFLNSTILSLTSAVGVVLLGLVVGYLLERTRVRGRVILDYIAVLPLGLAGTAFGVAVLVTYLNPPFQFLGLPGTLAILWIAYVAHFVSFGVRGVQAGLVQIAPDLGEAARMAGARRWRVVKDIEAPLLGGTLVSIGLLVIVLCFPELSMSIMLRSVDTQVAATALLNRWDGEGGFPGAAAMAVVMFAVIGVLLAVAQSFVAGRQRWKRRSGS